MSSPVVVLNASYEVLTSVSWERAVTMVVTGLAEIFEADDTRVVRSKTRTVPMPRIIRLVRYIYVKWAQPDGMDQTTHRSVLARDNHTCIYCAKKGSTVDHILPRSRGGENTWANLAACCKRCNNFKADRTPEEAGMKLLWEPRAPKRDTKAQQSIWDNVCLTNQGVTA